MAAPLTSLVCRSARLVSSDVLHSGCDESVTRFVRAAPPALFSEFHQRAWKSYVSDTHSPSLTRDRQQLYLPASTRSITNTNVPIRSKPATKQAPGPSPNSKLKDVQQPKQEARPPSARDYDAEPIQWKPTVHKVIDHEFAPEVIKEMALISERLFDDPRGWLQENELEDSIVLRPAVRDTMKKKLVHWFKEQLYYGPSFYVSRYMSLISARVGDPNCFKVFNLDEKDFAQRGYFMVIHAWLFHRRLILKGKTTAHYIFWEAVWNWFKLTLMSEEKIKEFNLNGVVRGIQEHALGFCLALDECLDEQDRWSGQVNYVLWCNVYRGKGTMDQQCVTDLTLYLMYNMQFMMALPDDVFEQATFVWPTWPPPDA